MNEIFEQCSNSDSSAHVKQQQSQPFGNSTSEVNYHLQNTNQKSLQPVATLDDLPIECSPDPISGFDNDPIRQRQRQAVKEKSRNLAQMIKQGNAPVFGKKYSSDPKDKRKSYENVQVDSQFDQQEESESSHCVTSSSVSSNFVDEENGLSTEEESATVQSPQLSKFRMAQDQAVKEAFDLMLGLGNFLLNPEAFVDDLFKGGLAGRFAMLPHDELEFAENVLLTGVRFFLLFIMLPLLARIVRVFIELSSDEASINTKSSFFTWILLIAYCLTFVISGASLGHSLVSKKLQFIKPTFMLLFLQNILVLFDFELYFLTSSMPDPKKRYVISTQILVMLLFQVLLAMLFHWEVFLPLLIISSLMTSNRIVLMAEAESQSSFAFFINNIWMIFGVALILLAFLGVVAFIYYHMKILFFSRLSQKQNHLSEILEIFDMMQLPVISKTHLGFGLCNSQGLKLLSIIQKTIQDEGPSLLLNHSSIFPIYTTKSQKLRRIKDVEDKIFQTKIFKLFQDDFPQKQESDRNQQEPDTNQAKAGSRTNFKEGSPRSGRQSPGSKASAGARAPGGVRSEVLSSGGSFFEENFSINDLVEMEQIELENKVFYLDLITGSKQTKETKETFNIESSLFGRTVTEQNFYEDQEVKDRMYVKIIRHSFSSLQGPSKREVLQIVDITDQIHCENAVFEKKLLLLTNATVSHEMRNPTNSILCQNVLLAQLSEKILEMVKDRRCISLKQFKRQLKQIYSQHHQGLRIQESSTKLLKFLVNDILDFGQIKAGKFRKDITFFNLREAVEEVMLILKFKAEQYGIEMKMKFDNFPIKEDQPNHTVSEKSQVHHSTQRDYMISSDNQRLQQILMNILSNALKFTHKGGRISVVAKYIRDVKDFDPVDFEGNIQATPSQIKEIMQRAKYGCIQIAVEDNGIGINIENQKKLFKLFGFLEATKELNTKGIGLGLHISRQIVKQLGGEIVCVSEWKRGTKFVFFLQLHQKRFGDEVVARYKNPIFRQYPRIKLILKSKQEEPLNQDQIEPHSGGLLQVQSQRKRTFQSREPTPQMKRSLTCISHFQSGSYSSKNALQQVITVGGVPPPMDESEVTLFQKKETTMLTMVSGTIVDDQDIIGSEDGYQSTLVEDFNSDEEEIISREHKVNRRMARALKHLTKESSPMGSPPNGAKQTVMSKVDTLPKGMDRIMEEEQEDASELAVRELSINQEAPPPLKKKALRSKKLRTLSRQFRHASESLERNPSDFEMEFDDPRRSSCSSSQDQARDPAPESQGSSKAYSPQPPAGQELTEMALVVRPIEMHVETPEGKQEVSMRQLPPANIGPMQGSSQNFGEKSMNSPNLAAVIGQNESGLLEQEAKGSGNLEEGLLKKVVDRSSRDDSQGYDACTNPMLQAAQTPKSDQPPISDFGYEQEERKVGIGVKEQSIQLEFQTPEELKDEESKGSPRSSRVEERTPLSDVGKFSSIDMDDQKHSPSHDNSKARTPAVEDGARQVVFAISLNTRQPLQQSGSQRLQTDQQQTQPETKPDQADESATRTQGARNPGTIFMENNSDEEYEGSISEEIEAPSEEEKKFDEVDTSQGTDKMLRAYSVAFMQKPSSKSELRHNFENNRRILIVDDEPYNQVGLTIILQQAVHQSFSALKVVKDFELEQDIGSEKLDLTQLVAELIDTANNGLEALNMVKRAYYEGQFSYGLILMDCSMPIMDGFEATDNIRTYLRKKSVPQPMITACTGHTEVEYVKRAWRYQMDEVIPKPANFQVIKQLVLEMIFVERQTVSNSFNGQTIPEAGQGLTIELQ